MQEVTLANIRTFVEEDPYNVDSFNAVGMPLLSWCVFHGQRDAVEYLVSMGADVNIQDLSKNTPLHIAVHRDNVDLTRYLIECQADVSAINSEGRTPLHLALIRKVDQKLLNVLIDATTNFSIADTNGKTTLYYCGNDRELFAQMIDRIDQQPWDTRDSNGKTLLMNYITNVEMVKYILSHPGINVNLTDTRGQTALHHAVMCRDVTVVKLLLAYPKCQRDKRDQLQQSPRDFAIKLGLSEIIALMGRSGNA